MSETNDSIHSNLEIDGEKKLQESILVLNSLKNLPNGISSVGSNWVEISGQNIGEKFLGANKSKNIAVMIDESGKLHFGKTILGNDLSEKAGRTMMKALGAKNTPEGNVLAGEAKVKEYLTPELQSKVLKYIADVAKDAKSSEDAKKYEEVSKKQQALGRTISN